MVVQKVHTDTITNVVDIIGDVVADVRAEYDASNEKPFYEHGHPREIVNTLLEKTQSSSLRLKKFPIIMLFEDFENEGKDGIFKSRQKLNIVIATSTDPNYKAKQRYDNSFDAILTPIYNLFLKHLKRAKGVHVLHKDIPQNTIYHLYWGKSGLYGNEGNVFNDYIDAIEMKNLDLKIYR